MNFIASCNWLSYMKERDDVQKRIENKQKGAFGY